MKHLSYFLSIATASLLVVLGRAQADDLTSYFGGVGSNEAYLDWHTANTVADRYTGRVYMPSDAGADQGAAVHWSVDEEFVYIAVVARATGWLGLGISQAGGMLGADMALFTAVRPDEIVDAYALDGRNPIRDECQQDWELVNSTVDTDGGFLMVEVRRLLDTGDEQDRVILNDSSPLVPEPRVIAAWGDTSEVGYHGDNRVRGAIRFFGQGDAKEAFQTAMAEEADGFFDIRAPNHTIAAIETEYVQFCISRQDLIAQGVPDTQDLLSVIGFEPILTEETAPYVHHFLVYTGDGAECTEDEFMLDLIYMWG
jgi:dopamine beta-monooxygenase